MAERELSKKLGEVEVDGLVTAIDPHIVIGAGVIRKAASGTLKLVRGTVLAKSSGTAGDSKLVVLGSTAVENETLTANCILCDDVEVGTGADATVAVYLAGCFNPDKLTMASSYTMKEADKDALRDAGIVFKAASPM